MNVAFEDLSDRYLKKARTRSITPDQVIDLVNRSVDTVVDRIKTKFHNSIEDRSTEALVNFSNEAKAELVATAMKLNQQGRFSDLMVMPNGTKLFRHEGDRAFLVVEQTPCVRTLSFDWVIGRHAVTGGGSRRCAVALPYVYFIFKIDTHDSRWIVHHSIAFRNKPLAAVTDEMGGSNLPNVHADKWEICVSKTISDINLYNVNGLAQYAERFIQRYWESTFNADLSSGFEAIGSTYPDLKTPEKWAEATRQDATFILRIKWLAPRTLDSMVVSHLRSAGNATFEQFPALAQKFLVSRIAQLGKELQDTIGEFDGINFMPAHLVDVLIQFMRDFLAESTKELVVDAEATVKQEAEKLVTHKDTEIARLHEEILRLKDLYSRVKSEYEYLAKNGQGYKDFRAKANHYDDNCNYDQE